MELTLEEKLSRIRNFRPIDDVFFEVLASNKDVCQEMLRTILEDRDLIVLDVVVQSSEKNLYGRSVRLDALCTLGTGKKVNIEVQRSDNDNHFKRVRFNESVITAKESNSGDDYGDIIELYVVYISEFDFIKGGKTTYHVDKIIRETGESVDDGVKEIYVNTVVDDGTDIADLMSCFTKKMVNNPKFPELTSEVKKIKETEKGASTMCAIMQEYENKARLEGRLEGKLEGRLEGKLEGRLESMWSLVNRGIISVQIAAQECEMTEEVFLQTKPTAV